MENYNFVNCCMLYLSFKIRYAVTDMRKLANRMAFGTPEESSLGKRICTRNLLNDHFFVRGLYVMLAVHNDR